MKDQILIYIPSPVEFMSDELIRSILVEACKLIHDGFNVQVECKTCILLAMKIAIDSDELL